jgi:hypothetical protein
LIVANKVNYSSKCGFIYRDAIKDALICPNRPVTHKDLTVSLFDRVTPSQFLRISVSAYTTPPRQIEYPSVGRVY